MTLQCNDGCSVSVRMSVLILKVNVMPLPLRFRRRECKKTWMEHELLSPIGQIGNTSLSLIKSHIIQVVQNRTRTTFQNKLEIRYTQLAADNLLRCIWSILNLMYIHFTVKSDAAACICMHSWLVRLIWFDLVDFFTIFHLLSWILWGKISTSFIA